MMPMNTEDIRTKVTVETHSLITALAQVRGVNPEAIAREILEKWAEEQSSMLTVAHHRAKAKGSKGILREL